MLLLCPVLGWAQLDSLYYDSGAASFLPEDTAVGTMWAVRFTPQEPCSLTGVQVVSYGAPGPAKLHLWADSAGYPGADMVPPVQVTLLGDQTYQEFQLPSPIDMGSADFHLGLEYIQVPPPYAVTDDDGNTDERSKVYRPSQGNWEILPNDLCIRVLVMYYQMADSIYYDGEPTYVVNDYDTIGSMFAVRFTPEKSHTPDTSFTLESLSIVTFDGAGSGKIHIWADDNGQPGPEIIDPFDFTPAGNLSRQVIYLPYPVNVGPCDFHF